MTVILFIVWNCTVQLLSHFLNYSVIYLSVSVIVALCMFVAARCCADYAVAICLSVRLSVRLSVCLHTPILCQNGLVFVHQTVWKYSDGGVEGGESRFLTDFSFYLRNDTRHSYIYYGM